MEKGTIKDSLRAVIMDEHDYFFESDEEALEELSGADPVLKARLKRLLVEKRRQEATGLMWPQSG